MKLMKTLFLPLGIVATLGATTAYAHHDDKALALEKRAWAAELHSLTHLHNAATATSLYVAKSELSQAYTDGEQGIALCKKAMYITKDLMAYDYLGGAVYTYNSSNSVMSYLANHATSLAQVRKQTPGIISTVHAGDAMVKQAIGMSSK